MAGVNQITEPQAAAVGDPDPGRQDLFHRNAARVPRHLRCYRKQSVDLFMRPGPRVGLWALDAAEKLAQEMRTGKTGKRFPVSKKYGGKGD